MLLIVAIVAPAVGVVTEKYSLSELLADAQFAGVVRIRSVSPVYFEEGGQRGSCGHMVDAAVEWPSDIQPGQMKFFAAKSVPRVEVGSTNLVILFSSDPQEVERLMASALEKRLPRAREELRCQIRASASHIRPVPPTLFRMERPDSTLDGARVVVEPDSVLLSSGFPLEEGTGGSRWVRWPLVRNVLTEGGGTH